MLRFLKPFAFVFVLTAFFSCSSDDNNNPGEPDPLPDPETITVLLPKRVVAFEDYFAKEEYTIDLNYTEDFLLSGFTLETSKGDKQETKAEYEEGKLIKFHNNISDPNSTVIFNYNDNNQLVGMEAAIMPTLHFSYNTNNQVAEASMDQLLVSTYQYNAVGNIEQAKIVITAPGQTVVEQRKFTYDNKNTPFKHTNYSFELDASELLSEINFIYKPIHNILTEKSDNGEDAENLYNYTYEYIYNDHDFPTTVRKITPSGKILEERIYEYEVHVIEVE